MRWMFVFAFLGSFGGIFGGEFVDPGAPEVSAMDNGMVMVVPEDSGALTVHGEAKALSEDAVVEDWPRFLGASDNCQSRETRLLQELSEEGLKRVWELEKGEGYSSPIIASGKLVLFHRSEGEKILECRNPETGELVWIQSYDVEYKDRYGYSNGPRGSPVIVEGRVYSLGVTGELGCYDLGTGHRYWKRSLGEEFQIRSAFFGTGSSPLVMGERLVIQVGGAKGPCVAAFDRLTGAMLWGAEKEWGASYASPIGVTVDGAERVLAFTGGESRPPHGGLLYLDAQSGEVLGRLPWRADKFESVNAVSPVVLSGNRVFLTQCYGGGSVLVQLKKDGMEVIWENEEVGVHWMNPVEDKGHLYLVDGRHQQTAELVCLELETGKEIWREEVAWEEDMDGRPFQFGIQRASLLKVDGRFLCLGEMGTLLWMDLSPEGVEVKSRVQLFIAPETWSLPCLWHGLLYVCQHGDDYRDGTKPRIICYDLRAE